MIKLFLIFISFNLLLIANDYDTLIVNEWNIIIIERSNDSLVSISLDGADNGYKGATKLEFVSDKMSQVSEQIIRHTTTIGPYTEREFMSLPDDTLDEILKFPDSYPRKSEYDTTLFKKYSLKDIELFSSKNIMLIEGKIFNEIDAVLQQFSNIIWLNKYPYFKNIDKQTIDLDGGHRTFLLDSKFKTLKISNKGNDKGKLNYKEFKIRIDGFPYEIPPENFYQNKLTINFKDRDQLTIKFPNVKDKKVLIEFE